MLRVLLLIGGALVLVILVVQVGPGEIVASLFRIGWGLVPMSALYAGHQALRAWACGFFMKFAFAKEDRPEKSPCRLEE